MGDLGSENLGSIPGLGRSPGGGHATHSSILAWKNPMDTGACRATVQRVGHDSSELAHTHAIEGYLVYFLVLAITDKAAINSMCRFL